MKPTAVLFALSIVSLTLAASAVFMSQHGSPPTPVTTTPVAVDTTALEESVARLAEEVDSLRARVAAVEQPPTAVADGEPSADGLPVETRDLAMLEEPIARAVEEIMEQNGVDYVRKAQALTKRVSARDGMTRWVRTRQDQLPVLRERIAEKLDIDRPRREQVTEIVDNAFVNMGTIIELLNEDPPPSDEESRLMMGEVKQSVGVMVGELDEILDDDELIQLGEITIASEMPRVGYAIIEEGKDQDVEDGADPDGDGG